MTKESMDQINVSLTNKLCTLNHRIKNKKGHRFLYGDFDRLVEDMKQVVPLQQETLDAIESCVISLISEANIYQCYQLWAIRCNQCASILVEFLPHNKVIKADIEKQQDTFADRFIWSFVLFPTFKDYCERLQMRPERACRVATLCFEHSDSGRRPHDMRDEDVFYSLFKCGHNLAEDYINTTNNYKAFEEWFKVLDPLHLEQILEMIEDCGREDDRVYGMIEDTLLKQLELLGKWLEGDTLSFIDFWKSKRIIDLLELVEDDVFFSVLQTLAKVESNAEVRSVIEFYTNDEEAHICEFAKQLLGDYNKRADQLAKTRYYVALDGDEISGVYSEEKDCQGEDYLVIDAPDNVLSLPTQYKGILIRGVKDFSCMSGGHGEFPLLKGLIVPESYYYIGKKNFSQHPNLELVYLPKNVRLRRFSFAYCVQLKRVFIGSPNDTRKWSQISMPPDSIYEGDLPFENHGIFERCHPDLHFFILEDSF
jgi:hypothetical protein